MDRLIAQGWVDLWRHLNPDLQEYSWWPNREEPENPTAGGASTT